MATVRSKARNASPLCGGLGSVNSLSRSRRYPVSATRAHLAPRPPPTVSLRPPNARLSGATGSFCAADYLALRPKVQRVPAAFVPDHETVASGLAAYYEYVAEDLHKWVDPLSDEQF